MHNTHTHRKNVKRKVNEAITSISLLLRYAIHSKYNLMHSSSSLVCICTCSYRFKCVRDNVYMDMQRPEINTSITLNFWGRVSLLYLQLTNLPRLPCHKLKETACLCPFGTVITDTCYHAQTLVCVLGLWTKVICFCGKHFISPSLCAHIFRV